MRPRTTIRCGFTLVELLVVLSIISVLVALLLPAVMYAREAARRTDCQNRMHQMGLALSQHVDARRTLPMGTQVVSTQRPFRGWYVELLPFMEQDSAFREIEHEYQSQPNPFSPRHSYFSHRMPLFECPSDPKSGALQYSNLHQGYFGITGYIGIAGINSIDRDGCLFADSEIGWRAITDGLSNTIVVGERPVSSENTFGWWYAGAGMGHGEVDHTLGLADEFPWRPHFDCRPRAFDRPTNELNPDCDAMQFWSHHSGGAFFLRADGSVHFVAYGSDEVLRAMSTRHGGETIPN